MERVIKKSKRGGKMGFNWVQKNHFKIVLLVSAPRCVYYVFCVQGDELCGGIW